MDQRELVINPNAVWFKQISDLIAYGCVSKPRGMKVTELLNRSVQIDMQSPIITVPGRRLNYQFMAAEAYWMLQGSDRLDWLTPYCSQIAQFSDDGIVMSGAYGPKIKSQIQYIIKTLLDDKYSRQAVLTIWERTPKPSKDIPCTISMQFLLRQEELHLIVNMRSNDIWLGFPYDIFSFSMVATYVALHLSLWMTVTPGFLYLNVGSQHLYHVDQEKAFNLTKDLYVDISGENRGVCYNQIITPDDLLTSLRNARLCDKHTPFTLP
jgi:thymidylate synthase